MMQEPEGEFQLPEDMQLDDDGDAAGEEGEGDAAPADEGGPEEGGDFEDAAGGEDEPEEPATTDAEPLPGAWECPGPW